MSTYTVTITLGGHAFSIDSGDPAVPDEPLYVLDRLRIAWEFDESAPYPSQPRATECDLTFQAIDVEELADVDLGTPVQVKLTSGGTLVAAFTGRVGAMSAVPVRRKSGTVLRYSLQCVDYTIDLAEIPLTLERPAESGEDRITALIEAIVAAGGPGIDVPASLLEAVVFDALSLQDASALDVFDDHLRQIVQPDARNYLVPVTTAGVLDALTMVFILAPGVALTWPPGLFQSVGGLFTVVPDSTPPVDPAGYDMGLLIDSGRVDESLEWSRSKFNGPNTVTVSTSDGTTVVASNAGPGDPKIKVAISSTLTPSSLTGRTSMARLYLPDLDTNRWSADRFVWRPSDADLATLPFSLTPDTDDLDLTPDHYAGPSCYTAQVVVTDVPDHINPASDSGYYAGCLAGVVVLVQGGAVLVEARIAKRLPRPAEGFFGATWDDLQAGFPAAPWSSVDPALSWYEARLAREPV